MTPEQIREAVGHMRRYIADHYGTQTLPPPKRANTSNMKPRQKHEAVAHVLYMLDKIEEFLRDSRHDKAMRFLSFVEGVLWDQGIGSIDDGKRANMLAGAVFNDN
jgi:hypothetical protein